MKILQTVKNETGTRIRIQNREDCTEYTTYSAVEYITKEWDRDHTWYYVLHMDNGETATYNTKEWQILAEAFVEFM